MTNIINNSFLNNSINKFNANKYVAGIFMILMNVGSKYIELDLSEQHKKFLSSKLIRRLLIFTIAFIATRDIIASTVLTACFIVIVLNLFDTKSNYCILPKSFRDIDVNKDGEISPEEIKNAYNILKKAGKI
jgi:hypothetical protein